MTTFERSTFHFVSTLVIAAVLSVPSAIAPSTLGLILVLLPLCAVFLVHRFERDSKMQFSYPKLIGLTLAIWAPFSIIFHAGHGSMDYEAVVIGLISWPLTLGCCILLRRASAVMDACENSRAQAEAVDVNRQ
jgi:ABC-type sulfate transport system permease subunit